MTTDQAGKKSNQGIHTTVTNIIHRQHKTRLQKINAMPADVIIEIINTHTLSLQTLPQEQCQTVSCVDWQDYSYKGVSTPHRKNHRSPGQQIDGKIGNDLGRRRKKTASSVWWSSDEGMPPRASLVHLKVRGLRASHLLRRSVKESSNRQTIMRSTSRRWTHTLDDTVLIFFTHLCGRNGLSNFGRGRAWGTMDLLSCFRAFSSSIFRYRWHQSISKSRFRVHLGSKKDVYLLCEFILLPQPFVCLLFLLYLHGTKKVSKTSFYVSRAVSQVPTKIVWPQ